MIERFYIGLFIVYLMVFAVCECQPLCGTTPGYSDRPRLRIFGGATAQYGKVPWQINIYENLIRKCGGTLISPSWVLTAAHCVITSLTNPNFVKIYRLIAGDHDITKEDIHEQHRFGVKTVVHPGFGQKTLINDIALLETDRPFEFGDYVVPACLPHFDETPFPYTTCIISGWGFTSATTKATELQKLELPVLHQKACSDVYYSSSKTTAAWTSKMLCAGYLDGQKDACQGDSGGPLTCPRYGKSIDAERVITGVVSWGRGCGQVGQAGVYTRVEPYLAWINQTLALPLTSNDDPCKYSGLLVYDQTQGTITSPGFQEGNYPNDRTCNWEIDLSQVTGPSSSATIRFETMDLEPPTARSACLYDYVQISSGDGQLLGKYCGSNTPAPLVFSKSSENKLKFNVVFHSDNTVTKKGFSLSFKSQ